MYLPHKPCRQDSSWQFQCQGDFLSLQSIEEKTSARNVYWPTHNVMWLKSKAPFLPSPCLGWQTTEASLRTRKVVWMILGKKLCMHAFLKFICKEEYYNLNEETFIGGKWATEIAPPLSGQVTGNCCISRLLFAQASMCEFVLSSLKMW